MKLSIALLASSLALAVASVSSPPCTTFVAISRAPKASLNITIDDGCDGTCGGGGGHPASGDDGAITGGSHGGGSSGNGGSLTNNNELAGLLMLVSGGLLLWGEF
jgi:uncharacterized membrane protein YgcG